MKDELAGEVPVAFIIRTEGSEISENEIKQFVAKEVIPNLEFLKYLTNDQRNCYVSVHV